MFYSEGQPPLSIREGLAEFDVELMLRTSFKSKKWYVHLQMNELPAVTGAAGKRNTKS